MQLNFTNSELNQIIPGDPTLAALIAPYLGTQGDRAQCLSKYFPLILTDTQSNSVMTGYLARLSTNLSTIYNSNKAASSKVWSSLSINIITSVLEMAKIHMNDNFITTTLWSNFLKNDWKLMSLELKQNYTSNHQLAYLHCGQLIDSATTTYNKEQSVNFLVD